jgi:hypothetical protein
VTRDHVNRTQTAGVTSTSLRIRGEAPERRRPSAAALLWAAYGVMGLLIAAYAASLLLRGDGQSWPLVDGWLVDAFELLAGVMCLARGLQFADLRGSAWGRVGVWAGQDSNPRPSRCKRDALTS